MSATWGTESIDFGEVAESKSVQVPGDFSSIVTLVVNVRTDGDPAFEWILYDSVDGERFLSVEDTQGYHVGKNQGTRRFVVPFGPHLSITVKTKGARLAGVLATVFWRGLG